MGTSGRRRRLGDPLHPRSGGRFVVARAATGSGDSGPSIEERYVADEAATALRDRGFDVEHEADRPRCLS